MTAGLRVPFIARWPGQIPADRPIDGIDMSEFWFGRQAVSGREGFPVYVGEAMHAAKWRHWKMHFIWQEYLYDLLDDPRERHHVFLRGNTWVIVPVGKMLRRWRESPQLFPPIPAGAAD